MAARYLADVPYPALARPLQDSLDASAAAIAASELHSAEKILAPGEDWRLLGTADAPAVAQYATVTM